MHTRPAEVQAQLEKILASASFSTSQRSAQFLRFCVEQCLLGNTAQIKESTVAVEVFKRTPDYDPKTDPIVRVQARRLRERLENYYAAEGVNDSLRILLPKGSYVPQTVRMQPPAAHHLSSWAAEPPLHPPHLPEQSVSASQPRRWKIWSVGTCLFVACILLLFLGIDFYRTHFRSSGARFALASEPHPLDAAQGRESSPAWSPDSRWLAYSWDGGSNGAPFIYLQQAGQTQPQRLTASTQPEFRPIWSPDGRELIFIRYRDEGHFVVVRASVNNHVEQVVGSFSYFWILTDDPPALDWSPDGKSLLVAEQNSPNAPVRLMQFSLQTGARTPLTNPLSGTSGDLDGKYSPDGSQIAFRRGGWGDLFLVDRNGESAGPVRKITPNNPGISGITWSPDGKHILFGGHGGGNGWGIWQTTPNGAAPSQLLTRDGDVFMPAISPDGKQLAVTYSHRTINLLRIALGGSPSMQPFVPSSQQDFAPLYSPDGRQVLFASTRSGNMEFWLTSADGSRLQQLTHMDGNGFVATPAWSPDSKHIVFALRRDGKTNLVLCDIPSGATRQITFATVDRYFNPVFSGDGHFIYFNANTSGAMRIWRIIADGSGQPEPMFWDVHGLMVKSQTDEAIFYPDSESDLRMVRRDLGTGATQEVFHSNRRLSSPQSFCVHGKMLYLLLSSIQQPFRSELSALDMVSGKLQTLQQFDRTTPGMETSCSVAPDGRSLLVTATQSDESNIYIAKLVQQ